jgi:hypothetical protein
LSNRHKLLAHNPSPDLHPVASRLLILHQIADFALDTLAVNLQFLAWSIERDDLTTDNLIPAGLATPISEESDHCESPVL